MSVVESNANDYDWTSRTVYNFILDEENSFKKFADCFEVRAPELITDFMVDWDSWNTTYMVDGEIEAGRHDTRFAEHNGLEKDCYFGTWAEDWAVEEHACIPYNIKRFIQFISECAW
jgi:hypothetical protein